MRIVLAYSGSRDGSAAIPWLRERHHAEVVTVTVDLGQGRALEAIRDRALSLGAQRAHVIDARELFAQEFIIPALRADAVHDGGVPMALALSRGPIAKKLVEIAAIERADAVAYGGRGSRGTSRLEVLLRQLAPALAVITPAREWSLSAADLDAFARRHGLGATDDDGSHAEANVWGRPLLTRAGEPAPPVGARSHAHSPDEPALVDIGFTAGVPTALNGIGMPLLELVSSLGTLAAIHGVGYRAVGPLACDAPAAVLLHAAHRDLTLAASSPDLEAFSAGARRAYLQAVETGAWFSPLREALDAYFAAAQAHVSGHVRLRLLKGEHATIGTDVSRGPEPVPARLISSATRS